MAKIGSWRLPFITSFEPTTGFQALAERPSWVGVFVAIVLVNLVLTVILTPTAERVAMGEMVRRVPAAAENPAYQDAVVQQVRAGQIVGAVAAPIAMLAKLAVVAGLLWAATVLGGGDCPYRSVFAMVTYASLPLFLGQYLGFGFMIVKGGDAISSLRDLQPLMGLNALVRPESAAMNTLLNSVSVFDAWYVVLLAVGLQVVARTTRSRAVSLSVGLWAVSVALVTLGAALGERFVQAANAGG